MVEAAEVGWGAVVVGDAEVVGVILAFSANTHDLTWLSISVLSWGRLRISRSTRSILVCTHPSRSSFGIHLSPETFRKNRASGFPCPAASLLLAFSLCLSSTSDLAAVAPCISSFLIASVSFAHSLSSASSGTRKGGHTFLTRSPLVHFQVGPTLVRSLPSWRQT